MQRSLECLLASSERSAMAQIKTTYDNLYVQLMTLENRQKKYQKLHDFMNEYCAQQSAAISKTGRRNNILCLNVGGKEIIIERDKIPSDKMNQNNLSVLLSDRWNHASLKDRRGLIFLDLDPAWIEPIFDAFRQNSKMKPDLNFTNDHVNIILSYYRLLQCYSNHDIKSSEVSTIGCMNDVRFTRPLYSFLCSKLSASGMQIKLKLVYRGSRDGYTKAAFQASWEGIDGCSNRLIVIEDTQGNVFGGHHVGKIWNTSSRYVYTPYEIFGKPLLTMRSLAALDFSQRENFIGIIGTKLSISVGCNRVESSVSIAVGSDVMRRFLTKEFELYEIVLVDPASNQNEYQSKTHDHRISEINRTPLFSTPLHGWICKSLVSKDSICTDFDINLLFKGTRDGFGSIDFHRMCDGKSNTICVIKTDQGHTIGGFSPISWDGPLEEAIVQCENSFIFDLGESHDTPIRYVESEAMTHSCNLLCAFESFTLHSDGVLNHINGRDRAIEIEVFEVLPKSCASSQNTESKEIDSTSQLSEKVWQSMLEKANVLQFAEEELLLELLWIEHLSISMAIPVPMEMRSITIGLLAEWEAICKSSADVLPLLNGVAVTNCGIDTLKKVEEVMERLGIIKVHDHYDSDNNRNNNSDEEGKEDSMKAENGTMIENAIGLDSAESACATSSFSPTTTTETQANDDDQVISFNVGGTIIAILRSTLLLHAPQSTFATNFSGRWSLQQEELDEHGNIYVVRKLG